MKRLPLLIGLLLFSMACAGMAQHSILDDSVQTSFTHDDENDQHRPVSNATVTEEENLIEKIDTKTISDVEWDVYQITMDDTGAVQVNFDASASYDPDHANESNTGIASYEWKVLYDAPYGDDSFDLQGHTFTEGSASNGDWTYIFSNVTSDSTGEVRNQIRVELIVYDGSGKFSDKFRFYFEVVPEGFGDEEPVVQIDTTLNGSQFTSDTLTITGNVISGAETQQDVYVEIAFDQDNFNANPLDKYTYQQEGIWNKTTDGLSDGDSFELTLNMDGLYSNVSQSQNIYIKIYEEDPADGRGERWVTIKFISLQLPACQGLQADPQAEAAGGEFILDENGECQWNGAWRYDSETGEWQEPEPQHVATFSLEIPVEAEVIEEDFFFVNGTILTTTHDETYIEIAFENSSFEASSVEKYDLQLNHLWNRSDGLQVEDNFSLGLSVESLRGNITISYDVQVRAFVYDGDLQKILTNEASFEIVVPYLDTDGDGIADDFDAFPNDPSETLDSDGDGVGDNSDVYPNDSLSWEETNNEGSDSNESVPGLEFWLLLLALIAAARCQCMLSS